MIDIMHLDMNYQLMIADINDVDSEEELKFPGVHFSMFIAMENLANDSTYTAVFLMNMLTKLSNINFNLYGGKQALGKIVFTVKDTYSISGMLIDKSHCIAVTTNEEPEIANALHKKIKTLCNRETLLFRKTNAVEMVQNYEYEQSIFSQNQCWLIGHPTEHFLPDDLHAELVDQYCKDMSPEEIKKVHMLHAMTKKVIENSPIRLLVHESAFTSFTVTGMLDFYGYKVQLTSEQRLRYIKHLYSLLTNKYNLEMKTIRGGLITDFQHIPDPTLFLSDSFCYLRLETNTPYYNICVPNKIIINDIFREFFNDIWNGEKYNLVENGNSLVALIQHAIMSIEIMSEMN